MDFAKLVVIALTPPILPHNWSLGKPQQGSLVVASWQNLPPRARSLG